MHMVAPPSATKLTWKRVYDAYGVLEVQSQTLNNADFALFAGSIIKMARFNFAHFFYCTFNRGFFASSQILIISAAFKTDAEKFQIFNGTS